MKTPREMLEDIHTELIENTALLGMIFRHARTDPETDCAMACLIRSQEKSISKAAEFIETLCINSGTESVKKRDDISDIVADAVIDGKSLKELTGNFVDRFFTDKDNDNPMLYMASVIHDYAVKVCRELKTIEEKIN